MLHTTIIQTPVIQPTVVTTTKEWSVEEALDNHLKRIEDTRKKEVDDISEMNEETMLLILEE